MEVFRDGKIYSQRFERGKKTTELIVKGETKRRGTKIHFRPDPLIFSNIFFDFELLASRMRELSFLTKGVKIRISDERTGRKKEFIYEGGIRSFVEYLNRNREVIHSEPIYISGQKNKVIVEIAFQYNNSCLTMTYKLRNTRAPANAGALLFLPGKNNSP